MRKLSLVLPTQHQGAPAIIRLFRRNAAQGRYLSQKVTAGMLALAMLPMGVGTAWAQDDGPPPPPDEQGQPLQDYQPLPLDQLDQLVAPIALYPDSLVAQVLAASTYPAQVVAAEQFMQQNGNYPADQLASFANTQPWDPSVKSLVAFPSVLLNLSQNMDWTTQLGNAYYNQPQDVLGSVQFMRQRAYEAGNLRSTPQYSVIYDPGNIVIAPVSPEIVYVPYYNPWIVYGAPVAVYPHYYYGPPRGIAFGAGLAIGFGVGIAIGAFSHYNWGYRSWGPNWGSRTVVFNHNTYISRSVTVVNHGYYGHFDRNPQARAFNQQQVGHFGGNRTLVNNVPVNRGDNNFNRGGGTFQNNGGAYTRGGNAYNGGNTAYRGQTPFNQKALITGQQSGSFNRTAQPQPRPTFNRGPQSQPGATFNRGTQSQPGTPINRGGQPPANFNRGTYQAPSQDPRFQRQPVQRQAPAPQQGGFRPQTYPRAPQQTQQRAAPQHSDNGPHADHGGHEQHH